MSSAGSTSSNMGSPVLGKGMPPTPTDLPPDAIRPAAGSGQSSTGMKYAAVRNAAARRGRSHGNSAGEAEGDTVDEKRHLFFYGSLMDPEVLQAVLGLSRPPEMEPGYITGFKIKLWGIYPTLVPDTDGSGEGKVDGMVRTSERYEHLMSLGAYETSVYELCDCEIRKKGDGDESRADTRVVKGLTFKWAEDPQSSQLVEGSLDFERYQKYYKPSVVRRRSRRRSQRRESG
jgi:gamma-glutamylcyclotransferase (GGCT)/AIG2-like uncharacterized protein YtfP